MRRLGRETNHSANPSETFEKNLLPHTNNRSELLIAPKT